MGHFKECDEKCGFYSIGKPMEFLNRRVTHEINALEPLIFEKHTGTATVGKNVGMKVTS